MEKEQAMNDLQGTENLERTYTQDEVSRIVRDRISREKAKATKALEQREAELKKRELYYEARERFTENELPKDLIDIIKFEDNDQLDQAIEILKEALKPKGVKGIRGTEPGQGNGSGSYEEDEKRQSDNRLRKAMGLST